MKLLLGGRVRLYTMYYYTDLRLWSSIGSSLRSTYFASWSMWQGNQMEPDNVFIERAVG